MRTVLSSTTARLGASILAALGLAPLTACDSEVERAGTGGGGGGSTVTSTSTDSTSSTSTSSTPDHPPTCEELSTSAQVTSTSVATSGGGVGGSGVGGAGGGSADLYARPCEDPEPILVGCLDTGVDQCANGFRVRREAVACPLYHRPANEYTCDAESLGGGADECGVDADCGAGSSCVGSSLAPPGGTACNCEVACETDADCGSDQLCLCGASAGRCVTATCKSDADCGPGLRCASMDTGGCDPDLQFHCQTDQDACIESGECLNDGLGDVGCVVDGSGARICETGHGCAAVGRPLVVHGEVRFAPSERRSDWSRDLDVAPPSDAVRSEVSARWAHVAAMEHASVASFARFAMDLLALGAPPELVAGASAAMLDEIEHARLSYGLAASFGDARVGPGPLDVSGAHGAGDLVELAVATFLEGCVAEGAAAAEAAVAATTSRDPAVVAVLERIAREEAQHAELAWKTIAWALDRDAVRVGPALLAALDRVSRPLRTSGDEPGLEAFGLLGPAEREAIRMETVRSVVGPVLGRLLARPMPTSMLAVS